MNGQENFLKDIKVGSILEMVDKDLDEYFIIDTLPNFSHFPYEDIYKGYMSLIDDNTGFVSKIKIGYYVKFFKENYSISLSEINSSYKLHIITENELIKKIDNIKKNNINSKFKEIENEIFKLENKFKDFKKFLLDLDIKNENIKKTLKTYKL